MYKDNKYVVINGGQQLPPVSSPDMGTAREMQESNTKRNSGEETYSNGFQLLGWQIILHKVCVHFIVCYLLASSVVTLFLLTPSH